MFFIFLLTCIYNYHTKYKAQESINYKSKHTVIKSTVINDTE